MPDFEFSRVQASHTKYVGEIRDYLLSNNGRQSLETTMHKFVLNSDTCGATALIALLSTVELVIPRILDHARLIVVDNTINSATKIFVLEWF